MNENEFNNALRIIMDTSKYVWLCIDEQYSALQFNGVVVEYSNDEELLSVREYHNGLPLGRSLRMNKKGQTVYDVNYVIIRRGRVDYEGEIINYDVSWS